MAFHIVLNRPTDLDEITKGARAGSNPRHSMAALAEALDATVHDGRTLRANLTHRSIGRVTRTSPLWWAIAANLRAQISPGDVIFCTGEDIGIPVAVLCGGMPGVRIAVMAHYIDRPKGRLALRLFRLRQRVSLFCTVAKPQAVFLDRFFKPYKERVLFLWDQTDTAFFRPGPPSSEKARPIVMSVGLEQRDYNTLAAATADLDVDVQISGYSADTRVLTRALPKTMPMNMRRRFYAWPDLLQLYRDADVVVVSLFPNSYAAGVQALMEALACGRPVVVTATDGLQGYLNATHAMRVVAPGDPIQLQRVIKELLERTDEGRRMADEARVVAQSRHKLEQYVSALVLTLRSLAAR